MIGMKTTAKTDMTEEQVKGLFRSFDYLKADIPKKGHALIIAHPDQTATRITVSTKLSTYGKRLYTVLSYIKI